MAKLDFMMCSSVLKELSLSFVLVATNVAFKRSSHNVLALYVSFYVLPLPSFLLTYNTHIFVVSLTNHIFFVRIYLIMLQKH